MSFQKLTGRRIAVLAADGFEQVELTKPVEAFRHEGADVDIISLRPGKIRGMNHLVPGRRVSVDRTLADARPDMYDALLLPGGLINPDTLRHSEEAREFVRAFDRAGKPIAVICHGPWLLVSAGLAVGRALTSWPAIREDITNAGGVWRDEPVVRHENWVSSRGPQDLPYFIPAACDLFAAHAPAAARLARPARPRSTVKWVAATVGVLAAGIAIQQIAART